jgi:hypothetical protein
MSIPKADEFGKVIPEEEEESEEEEEEDEEEESEPEVPLENRVNQAVIDQIAKDRINKAKQSGANDRQTNQVQQKVKEQQKDFKERCRVARLMNEKRKKYDKKIDYKFRPKYDPNTMSLEQLTAENDD